MDEEVIIAVRKYVERLIDEGYDVRSAVLFGSRARGDWLETSDVDLLLVIGNSDRSLLERIAELLRRWDRPWALEVFPYTLTEIRELMNRGSVALYDALDHGLVIYDDGTFAMLKRIFKRALEDGTIERVDGWWTLPKRPIPLELGNS